MGGTAIRLIDSEDEEGLSLYVRIRNAVTPDNTDSLDQLRWETATYPGQVVHLLAEAPDGWPSGLPRRAASGCTSAASSGSGWESG